MTAGAPYGNRNAEKWTFRKAILLFKEAIELSSQKEETTVKQGERIFEVDSYKFDFIGEVARELGTFKEIFSHLAKRFKTLERLHNQLITNLESNCYYNTKKGMIKEATGIVNLKSNHKWVDRQTTEVTGKDGSPLIPAITIEIIDSSDKVKDDASS